MTTYYQIQTRGMNPLTAREYVLVAGNSAKPIFTDTFKDGCIALRSMATEDEKNGVLIIFDEHGAIAAMLDVGVEDGDCLICAHTPNGHIDAIYQSAARAFAATGAQHGTHTLQLRNDHYGFDYESVCGWILTAKY